jgi:hypothetical protein
VHTGLKGAVRGGPAHKQGGLGVASREPVEGCRLPSPPQVADGSLHPTVPPDCHPALADLLLAIFSPDPLERPSFGLVVARLEAVLHEVRQQAAAAQSESLLGRWSKNWGRN